MCRFGALWASVLNGLLAPSGISGSIWRQPRFKGQSVFLHLVVSTAKIRRIAVCRARPFAGAQRNAGSRRGVRLRYPFTVFTPERGQSCSHSSWDIGL